MDEKYFRIEMTAIQHYKIISSQHQTVSRPSYLLANQGGTSYLI